MPPAPCAHFTCSTAREGSTKLASTSLRIRPRHQPLRHSQLSSNSTDMTSLIQSALSIIGVSKPKTSRQPNESDSTCAPRSSRLLGRLNLHLTIKPETAEKWVMGDRQFSLTPDAKSNSAFDTHAGHLAADVMTPLSKLCTARRLLAEVDDSRGELRIDWDTEARLMSEQGLALVESAAALDLTGAHALWEVVATASTEGETLAKPPSDDEVITATANSFDMLQNLFDGAKRAQQEQVHSRRKFQGTSGGTNQCEEIDPFCYLDKVGEDLKRTLIGHTSKRLPSTPPRAPIPIPGTRTTRRDNT